MKVCGREFTPELIDRIQAFVAEGPAMSRRSLSREVCQWMDWRGPNGKLKQMSCRRALATLDRRGVVQLPAVRPFSVSRHAPRRPAPDLLDGLEPVAGDLASLGPVELVLVDRSDSPEGRVWNALMDRHHPQRSGPLCGAQLRYLVRSARHGWLGGLAFSSAAWRVADRDVWIGWNDAERQRHLPKVVANSRFLIRPDVRVPHLASHVLSRCLRRLGKDWASRYGVEPLLVETFVEPERFTATSYRAANWQRIGTTQGRGRGDRHHRCSVPRKDIYVYPLQRDWRERLGTPGVEQRPGPRDEPRSWAHEEFGRAALGDRRLTQRLVTIARDFFARIQANIPQACGSRAKTKAAYRFFDHPDTTMQSVLRPHIDATVRRLGGHPVVLAVQDTTALNYTAHPATEGIGPIGSQPQGPVGLWLHSTLAFTPEATPLGFLDAQCWARDPRDFGKKARRHELPIEEKESVKWLQSYQAVAQAQRRVPQTRLVSVGDRESDIYELFVKARDQTSPRPELLVRAEQNRATTDEQTRLWESMGRQPVAATVHIRVPERKNQPAREADLSVRYAPVELRPPRAKSRLGKVKLWAVWAVETDPPAGAEAVEWMLLTTIAVESVQDALEKLRWYAVRWGIEVFHRTLKSGCRIEDRQLQKADRLEACLAIDMVVAWRVFHLAKLGREVPQAPCTAFCTDEEWQATVIFSTANPVLPPKPPTLREYVRMVGALGGHLGRTCDGEPGTETLWRGMERVHDITRIYRVMAPHVPHLQNPAVSSSRDYG